MAHHSLEAPYRAALATFLTENLFFLPQKSTAAESTQYFKCEHTSPWAARAHLCLWESSWNWLMALLGAHVLEAQQHKVWDIPLVESDVLAVSTSSFWYTPGSLMGRAGWGAEKPLMLGKHCSAVTKTLMCSQHCFDHKSRTQHRPSCYEENSPVKTCTPLNSSEEAKSELFSWYFVTKGQKMDEICR